METVIPEKAALLERLAKGGFNVPEFIYVSAVDFKNENFKALETFLDRHRESFKVIARSAHLKEEYFKGGTFDSLETYADLGGIQYARKKIIKLAENAKRLSIRRQQKFSNAPEIDLENMGMIVMPFISGVGVISIIKKKYPGIPVIAITGWGEHPGALATEAQADIVLEKPIELPDLDKLVTDLLAKKEGQA